MPAEKPTCPCGLEKSCTHPYMGIDGSKNPKILVVGSAPDEAEDAEGHLFIGTAGKFLRRILKESGVDVEQDVGFVNVLGCCPPNKYNPTPAQMKACAPNLLKVLEDTSDTVKLVLLLGNFPMRQLLNRTGITKWHGKSTYVGEVIYHPTYHPLYCLQYPETMDVFIQDIQTGLRLMDQPVRDLIPDKNVDSAYLLEHMNDLLNPNQYLAYDCETNGLDPYSDDASIIGVSLSWADDDCCFVTLEHPDVFIPPVEWALRVQLLKQILESNSPKVGQNAKFDRQFLSLCLGVEVQGDVADTLLDHHLLDERKGTHKLSMMVKAYLPEYGGYDSRMETLMDLHDNQMVNIPLVDIVPYACGDAFVTRKLAIEFEKPLEEQGLLEHSRENVLPANLVYTKMEMRGVKWDESRAKVLRRDYLQKVKEMRLAVQELPIALEWEQIKLGELEVEALEAQLVSFQQTGRNLKGHRFTEYQEKSLMKKIARFKEEAKLNPNAHAQIQKLVYDICKLPKQINRKSGNRSTDKEAREALLALVPSTEIQAKGLELIKALNYYSKISKLSSGYTAEYTKHIHDDGLVHTSFNQQGTVTGRLSSTGPNLQQIPRNLYLGSDPDPEEVWLAAHNIKSMFISKFKEDGYIVNADYSQLELRLMACLSGDSIMVEAYKNGIDLHTLSAKLLYPGFDDMDKVRRKELRQLAKTWNFASAYSFQKEFLEMYPGLGVWVAKMQDEAKTNYFMVNPLGRRRRLPEIARCIGRDFSGLNHALRQAVNFMIQSTGHELLMRAIIKVEKAVQAAGLRSSLVLEVHDSIMVDCHKSELDMVTKILYREMSDMGGLDWVIIPITAEVSYGPNWADQTEIEVGNADA